MFFNLSKRAVIRIISFTIALIIIISAVAFMGYSLTNRYRVAIEQTYSQALNEFSDYVTNLQVALTKGEYASTQNMQYTTALNISQEALGAKSSLSRLPITYGEYEKLQKFLSQVGDFGNYLLAKFAKDEEISDDDKEGIRQLSEYCEKLAIHIEDISALYANGHTYLGLEEKIESNLDGVEHSAQTFTLDKDFEQLNKEFESYPTLLYDGPFADQVQQKEPRLLEGLKEISKTQALEIAAKFLNTDKTHLSYEYTTSGNIPSYRFEFNSTTINVTVQGGYVEQMHNTANVTTTNIKYKEAIQKATSFLNSKGYENMKESYYFTSNNICTINFAYTQDGVVCYSDLIKVGVSLDTGEIMSFNAQGYIMNNFEREIEEPEIKLVDIQLNLSEDLTYEENQLVLIPTGGSKEIFCYEIQCLTQDGKRILIYINADTNEEENIFILLSSDGGNFVI